MTREDMLGELRGFVVHQLISDERFDIDVPQGEVTPANLENLDSYVAMLMRMG